MDLIFEIGNRISGRVDLVYFILAIAILFVRDIRPIYKFAPIICAFVGLLGYVIMPVGGGGSAGSSQLLSISLIAFSTCVIGIMSFGYALRGRSLIERAIGVVGLFIMMVFTPVFVSIAVSMLFTKS